MYLPEKLQNQSFVEWNHLVKGLMKVWDIAQLLGLGPCLSQQLQSNPDSTLIEQLGCIGNDRAVLASVLFLCWQALGQEEALLPGTALGRASEACEVCAVNSRT